MKRRTGKDLKSQIAENPAEIAENPAEIAEKSVPAKEAQDTEPIDAEADFGRNEKAKAEHLLSYLPYPPADMGK